MTKKKVLFPLAAAALLAVCLPQASRASMIYDIVDYPGLENGWTLSGTITTDGTIGTLSASDITAWSWTLTNGATTDNWNSGVTGGLHAYTQVDGGLTATATELEMGTPGQNQSFGLVLGFEGGPGTGGQLIWGRAGADDFGDPANDTYEGYFKGNFLFDDNVLNPPGLTLTGSTNWVIAEVPSQSSAAPEPGTVALFVLGVAGIAVGRTRRKA